VVLNFMPAKRGGYYYSYSHQAKYYRRDDTGNVPTPPVTPARMPNDRSLAQKETGD
jgi:hypothetical protein